MPTTLYWHDYETSGIDPKRDRALQFAGIRTDHELNIIGKPLEIYAKPADDLLPHPEATLVTGITPQKALANGLCEADFIEKIHHELSRPGTCGVGYNTIRFDDEFTRYTLYRNFYDPYEREWQGGNSRWDLIDVVRATHDLRPDGINWPKYDTGRTNFRLESLTAANGIGHENAHDALADVHATIAMARLIRDRQPKLFDYFLELRKKERVRELIDTHQHTPIIHTSGMLSRDEGCSSIVVPLIWHPNNKNSVVVFDLRSDPAPLIALSVDEIYDRLYTRSEDLPEGVERIALKEIHINKAPVIAPLNVLNSESAERLAINSKQCELHRQQIIQSLGLINDKLHQLYQRKPNWEPLTDPDHRLYDGFLKPADKKESLRLRQTAPEQLNEQSWYFEDERLQELLFRYRARNWPEQLSAEERARWDEYRRERLIEGRDERSLTFEQFFEAITRLKEEPNSDSATLGALEQYGQELLAGLQNSTKQ
ncbi:MAG: exodeoxyribonuclease I [Gammaproteobacteria bacterium]|nr:exodeoxyribonuclease I [Gammaproteobacteria bacterium]